MSWLSKVAWVTGAGGLLGHWLVRTAPAAVPGVTVLGLRREDLELTDYAAVRDRFLRDAPGLVIHCAALSKTSDCEADPGLARRINVDATAALAELAADIPLVFFSSDLVFDGRVGRYRESAPVNPLSVYGATKVAAERVVLANPNHTVIRTSINAGASPKGNHAINELLRRAWDAGQAVSLFTDEYRCPIAAEVTARSVWELAAKGCTGLYHVAGSERLSRWELGRLLAARRPDRQARIVPDSLRTYAGPPRPPDTSLDCGKAQEVLSFPLPGFTHWLAEHADAQL